MHEGCSGTFNDGLQVLQKLRMMGFNTQPMPVPAYLKCRECDEDIVMVTFEFECPHCKMIHVVTPCHAFEAKNIVAAGKNV